MHFCLWQLRVSIDIMGKMKIGFNCCFIADILTECFRTFLCVVLHKHKPFMQITQLDLLPLQMKG